MTNMSGVMEKTLSSLPGLLAAAVKGKSFDTPHDDFKKFMKNINRAKSKQEEEEVVIKQITAWKEKFANPQITNVQKRYGLSELLFCYMLGYDVSFSYIYAVKLAQQGNLFDKRAGYLLCSLFMNETHELAMLLINTIHKDLKSSDILIISSALNVVCQLISCEMIPALLPLVEEKLSHSSAAVRKKAVICIHQFYRKAEDLIQSSEALFVKALCDKDPGVMWATVQLYLDLIKDRGASSYRPMVGLFTDILMQVVSRKLSTEYEYRSIPAPWLTISLLRILALLGHRCENTSMQMYPVLREVSQRTEPTQAIGLAVISQCVETICTIIPDTSLLQFASKVVAKFLSANNINIRYIGLRALSQLVSVDMKYTINHQKTVIEFLEHEDLTVQRQTFHLLFQMANPKNIQIITKKLLDCLKQSTDKYLRNDIVTKVVSLTQRYSNDEGYAGCTDWYLTTINELLRIDAGELPHNMVCNVMNELDQREEKTLQTAATIYWQVLQDQYLPELLLQLASWVVSSYFTCLASLGSIQVTSCLLSWLTRPGSADTQRVVLIGLRKLLPQLPQEQIPLFVESIQEAVKSPGKEILQMIKELKELSKKPSILLAVTNGVHEDKMDFTLSFLDGYVSEALENGESPYKPASYRTPKHLQIPDQSVMKFLRLDPYESEVVDSSKSGSLSAVSSVARSADSTEGKTYTDLQLKGVKRVWGREGFNRNESSPSSQKSQNHARQVHHPPVQKTEEEIQREAFTTALFSGIDTLESDIGGQESFQADNAWLSETDREDSGIGYIQLSESSDFLSHDVLTTGHRKKETRVERLQTNAEQSHLPRVERFESGTVTNHRISPVVKQNCMAKSHVIRDATFETDSLDGGSPEREPPPMLFHSEHEEVASEDLLSSQKDRADRSLDMKSNVMHES